MVCRRGNGMCSTMVSMLMPSRLSAIPCGGIGAGAGTGDGDRLGITVGIVRLGDSMLIGIVRIGIMAIVIHIIIIIIITMDGPVQVVTGERIMDGTVLQLLVRESMPEDTRTIIKTDMLRQELQTVRSLPVQIETAVTVM